MTDEFVTAVQKILSDRVARPCSDHNCQYIKAAVIEMMIPYIEPLAQVVEDKARRYTSCGEMSVDNFISEIIYEVMSTMGKFAGTSVQTTMEVCGACTQAAALEKGERH
jgi:hypothetical protein